MVPSGYIVLEYYLFKKYPFHIGKVALEDGVMQHFGNGVLELAVRQCWISRL